jgi:hypothetical protein
MTIGAAGRISALFRKPGILELTQVTDIFRDHIRTGAKNAEDVEYVTIPGTFFNDSRKILNLTGVSRMEKNLAVILFGAFAVGTELLKSVPMWRLGMARPHDGIVEEQCVRLHPSGPGRWSEKKRAIELGHMCPGAYLHIIDPECDNLVHTDLQNNKTIMHLVSQLILCSSLHQWLNNLSEDERNRLVIQPQP